MPIRSCAACLLLLSYCGHPSEIYMNSSSDDFFEGWDGVQNLCSAPNLQDQVFMSS
jgi:hypothetical protein